VTRGRIGVTIQEITRDLAESFGLPNTNGALISSVEKDGPADKAGIQASDIILKFDGKTVDSSVDLPRIVAATRPGSKAVVQLWRKGKIKEVRVTVGELPGDNVPQRGSKRSGSADSGVSIERVGLTLSELTPDQRQELQVEGGLLVEDARGPAARAGLQRGDVILSINNEEVGSVEKFNEVLKQIPKGRNVALLVRRGDGTSYIAIKLDEK
jgi:serine protease Do